MAIRLIPVRLIGQTIRGIRNRLGMAPADFADSLGVDPADLARWERGDAQPDYGTLAKVATMGLVDVLVFHDSAAAGSSPQLTPGEAGELREILAKMEELTAQARAIAERAVNRTAVDILDAASHAPPALGRADALVLDAELRVETAPRREGRSRTAAAGRRSPSRADAPPRSRGTRASSSSSGASSGGAKRSSASSGSSSASRSSNGSPRASRAGGSGASSGSASSSRPESDGSASPNGTSRKAGGARSGRSSGSTSDAKETGTAAGAAS